MIEWRCQVDRNMHLEFRAKGRAGNGVISKQMVLTMGRMKSPRG